MPWCPKCRNEYRTGMTTCHDCQVLLVDSLEQYDREQEAEHLLKLQKEAEKELTAPEDTEEEPESILSQEKPSSVYIKKEDRYKDTLSSAYTFLFVGFGGLLLLLLVVTDVIDLNLAAPGKYVTYSGVGIMLAAFVIIGFYTLGSAKKLAKEADSENQLTEDIMTWFNKNITIELMENGITDDMGEELKYFKRFDNIKLLITKTYGELNDSYLDKLADDIYQDKF